MRRSAAALLGGILLLSVLCSCREDNAGADTAGEKTAPAPSEVSGQEDGADGVSNTLSVPERLETVWLSNTGRTTITVDAAVEYAGAVTVPVIEVSPRSITPEEAEMFAEAAFEDMPYSAVENEKKPGSDEVMLSYASNTCYENYYTSQPVPARSVDVMLGKGDRLYSEATLKRHHDPATQPVVFSSVLVDSCLNADGWASGTSLSPEDAVAYAERVINSFAPDMECAAVAASPAQKQAAGTGFSDGEAGEDAGISGYSIHFTRPYAGIGTTYTDEDCISRGLEDEYAPSYRYEGVQVVVSEYGLEYLSWVPQYRVVATVDEAAALLSFDEIASVAEKMIPLRFTSYECEQPNEMNISRIVFGYARVRMRDDPTRFVMIPVWDFFGNETTALVDAPNPFHSLLTVNAIDGTVVDRNYGY